MTALMEVSVALFFLINLAMMGPARADGTNDEEKTWVISLAANWPPYDYINDEGEIEGFQVSIIEEACKRANKSCSIMLADDKLCYDPDLKYGPGLSHSFFVASSGWANTIERKLAYDFTAPIIHAATTHLYRKVGTNWTLDTAKKIGFRRAWYTSTFCLKKTYPTFDVTKAVIYSDWPELTTKLLDGTVDLVFATQGVLGDGVESIDVAHQCADAHFFMHRKDVRMPWMAEAVKALKADGTYQKLCDQTWQGKKPKCVPV